MRSISSHPPALEFVAGALTASERSPVDAPHDNDASESNLTSVATVDVLS